MDATLLVITLLRFCEFPCKLSGNNIAGFFRDAVIIDSEYLVGFYDWILLVLWTFDIRFRDQILDPKVQGLTIMGSFYCALGLDTLFGPFDALDFMINSPYSRHHLPNDLAVRK